MQINENEVVISRQNLNEKKTLPGRCQQTVCNRVAVFINDGRTCWLCNSCVCPATITVRLEQRIHSFPESSHGFWSVKSTLQTARSYS